MSALLRITEGFVIKILGNESSSVEVVTDFVLTAFWAVFFGAALPAFEKNVSGPLGRQLCVNWAGEAGSGQEPAGPNSASSDSTKNAKEMQEGVLKKPKVAPTKEEEATIRKFQESLWKMVVYGLFTAIAIWVISDEKYVFDVKHHWTGCAGVPCKIPRADDHRFIYAVEMGFYAFSIPHLLLFETKRKDFFVMVMHHLVTLLLIAFSLSFNFMRIGVPVMALHDVCDIFLEGAKAFKYTSRHTGRSEFWVERLFELFFVVWILTRIVYYPFWIIYSSIYQKHHVVVGSDQTMEDVNWVFNGFYVLLFGLLAMHIYWTFLIARIAYRQIVHGYVEDEREED